ncbi:MAG: O-antigen ligase family protein [Nitrospinota bacterium]
MTQIHFLDDDHSAHNLIAGVLLLLIGFKFLALRFPDSGIVYFALLLPPIGCLAMGLWRPAWGMVLGAGILATLTVEVSAGSEVSVSAAKLTLLAMVLLGALNAKKIFRNPPPLLVPWLAYLGASAVSGVLAGMPMGAVWSVGEAGVIFLVFAAAAGIIRDDASRRSLSWVLALAGALVAALWLLQVGIGSWAGVQLPLAVRVGVEKGPSFYRGSVFAHQNFLAAFFLLTGGIFFALLPRSGKGGKNFLMAGGLITWAILFMLGSIGALVGLCGAVLLGAILFGNRWQKYAARIGLVSLIAIVAATTLNSSDWNKSLRLTPDSVQVRVYAIRLGLRSWMAHPVFGSGPGSFEKEVLRLEKKTSSKLPYFRNDKNTSLSAHNVYLKNFVERGAAGGLAFVFLILSYLYGIFRYSGADGRRIPWIFIGLAAFALSGLFEDVFSYSSLHALFWTIGGAYLGIDAGERTGNTG